MIASRIAATLPRMLSRRLVTAMLSPILCLRSSSTLSRMRLERRRRLLDHALGDVVHEHLLAEAHEVGDVEDRRYVPGEERRQDEVVAVVRVLLLLLDREGPHHLFADLERHDDRALRLDEVAYPQRVGARVLDEVGFPRRGDVARDALPLRPAWRTRLERFAPLPLRAMMASSAPVLWSRVRTMKSSNSNTSRTVLSMSSLMSCDPLFVRKADYRLGVLGVKMRPQSRQARRPPRECPR